ncbi:helix-turn-helix domain-containing protein [Rhodoplanes roseus]|nr:AraC family transcriptional regulator [Rhodoplanes roseus]
MTRHVDTRDVSALPSWPRVLTFDASCHRCRHGGSEPGIPVATVRELLQHAIRVLECDKAAAKHCLLEASALLPAAGLTADLPLPDAPGGLAPWQIQRVRAHVEADIASPTLARDLSKVARLSAAHFSRKFKLSFGETPRAFVTARRIERAKALMTRTGAPLSEIALACGFADQAHFSRSFRRMVGISPNTWRRERRGRPDQQAPSVSRPERPTLFSGRERAA